MSGSEHVQVQEVSPSQQVGGWKLTGQQWLALLQAYWRGKLNRWVRDSVISRTVGSIFLVLFCLAILAWFAISCLLGVAVARGRDPSESLANLAIWNGLSVMFFIFWIVGLFNDATRGDTLSLQRLMHLPISPASVFGFNYLLSWINIPLVFLLVSGCGLVIGSSLKLGVFELWKLIPVVSFAALISAWTSHLQGKLMIWMVNPKTRTRIMTIMPIVLALFGFGIAFGSHFLRRLSDAPSIVYWIRVADASCPLLWLADVLSGKSLLGLWALIWIPSMWLLTTWSLVANYKMTRKYYQDGFDATQTNVVTHSKSKSVSVADRGKLVWMERSFPGLSEAASAIAAMTWTTFWRSPQLKLAMLIPLIQPFFFLLLFSQKPWERNRATPPAPPPSHVEGPRDSESDVAADPDRSVEGAEEISEDGNGESKKDSVDGAANRIARAASGFASLSEQLEGGFLFGFAVFAMFMGSTFAANIFGFDRSGFRFWVLSSIPRVEILRGRNWIFGLMVLSIGFCAILVAAVFWGYPLRRAVEAIGAVFAFVPIYMVLTNLISILAPFPMASQGFQPKEFSWKAIVLNLALSMLIPLLMFLCCIPWGIEWVLHTTLAATRVVPWALILFPFLVLLSYWVYEKLLVLVAELFHSQELSLLKTVTSIVEK
jgi:hypothetical protein